MKMLSTAAIVTATLLLAEHAGADDKESFVKRIVYRLEKNNNNATQVDKIKVKVGDAIEIEWNYPVVPGAIPYDASGKSDREAVVGFTVEGGVRSVPSQN